MTLSAWWVGQEGRAQRSVWNRPNSRWASRLCSPIQTVISDGQLIGLHEGGHTPFTLSVGHLLTGSDHVLVVRAFDRLTKLDQARGKQHWRTEGTGIFYTPTTGIWQTVWLEAVPPLHITDVSTVCDIGQGSVRVETLLSAPGAGLCVDVLVRLDGVVLATGSASAGLNEDCVEVTVILGQRHHTVTDLDVIDGGGVALWSPESPTLYDLEIELRNLSGTVVDHVDSYFGMRSIETRNGQLCLNGRPYEQRLVLDQGYWPGGLMTAPTDDDLRLDIELAKQLGFNGARKHQKIEDPRWLTWADRIGFLVWDEMPAGYRFSRQLATTLIAEFAALIARDRSHPCVVAWVPINESWGVPDLSGDPRQVALLGSMYQLAHVLDGTRPVISNDGWEQAQTDIVTFHDYRAAEDLARDYADRKSALTTWTAGRPQFVTGHRYAGQPLMLTEFGGLNLAGADEGWGYETCADGDDLLRRYGALVSHIRQTAVFQGFCYTQLTDVESETNGLLTVDREPKVDMAKWNAVTDPSQR